MLLSNIILVLCFICFNNAIAMEERYQIPAPDQVITYRYPNNRWIKDMLETWKQDIDQKLVTMENNILDSLDKKFKEIMAVTHCISVLNKVAVTTESKAFTNGLENGVAEVLYETNGKNILEGETKDVSSEIISTTSKLLEDKDQYFTRHPSVSNTEEESTTIDNDISLLNNFNGIQDWLIAGLYETSSANKLEEEKTNDSSEIVSTTSKLPEENNDYLARHLELSHTTEESTSIDNVVSLINHLNGLKDWPITSLYESSSAKTTLAEETTDDSSEIFSTSKLPEENDDRFAQYPSVLDTVEEPTTTEDIVLLMNRLNEEQIRTNKILYEISSAKKILEEETTDDSSEIISTTSKVSDENDNDFAQYPSAVNTVEESTTTEDVVSLINRLYLVHMWPSATLYKTSSGKHNTEEETNDDIYEISSTTSEFPEENQVNFTRYLSEFNKEEQTTTADKDSLLISHTNGLEYEPKQDSGEITSTTSKLLERKQVFYKVSSNTESAALGCKKLLCNDDTFFFDYNTHIDIDDLTNSIVKRNSNGDVTYFETHLIIPRSRYLEIGSLFIRLSPTNETDTRDNFYEIKWYYLTEQIDVYVERDKHNLNRFRYLDSDFVAIYIKISEEGFEFGKKGEFELTENLITVKNDGKIFPIKYLSFNGRQPIFYDCPV